MTGMFAINVRNGAVKYDVNHWSFNEDPRGISRKPLLRLYGPSPLNKPVIYESTRGTSSSPTHWNSFPGNIILSLRPLPKLTKWNWQIFNHRKDRMITIDFVTDISLHKKIKISTQTQQQQINKLIRNWKLKVHIFKNMTNRYMQRRTIFPYNYFLKRFNQSKLR